MHAQQKMELPGLYFSFLPLQRGSAQQLVLLQDGRANKVDSFIAGNAEISAAVEGAQLVGLYITELRTRCKGCKDESKRALWESIANTLHAYQALAAQFSPIDFRATVCSDCAADLRAEMLASGFSPDFFTPKEPGVVEYRAKYSRSL